jgi:hypothetical protein
MNVNRRSGRPGGWPRWVVQVARTDVLSRRADPHALLKIAALLPRRPHLPMSERCSLIKAITPIESRMEIRSQLSDLQPAKSEDESSLTIFLQDLLPCNGLAKNIGHRGDSCRAGQ